MEKIQTYIAGVPHRKPDLSDLKIGNFVTLEPEPTNEYDPNAIKVWYNGVHLGYIPKKMTEAIKHLTKMTITSINPEAKWQEVELEGDARAND